MPHYRIDTSVDQFRNFMDERGIKGISKQSHLVDIAQATITQLEGVVPLIYTLGEYDYTHSRGQDIVIVEGHDTDTTLINRNSIVRHCADILEHHTSHLQKKSVEALRRLVQKALENIFTCNAGGAVLVMEHYVSRKSLAFDFGYFFTEETDTKDHGPIIKPSEAKNMAQYIAPGTLVQREFNGRVFGYDADTDNTFILPGKIANNTYNSTIIRTEHPPFSVS